MSTELIANAVLERAKELAATSDSWADFSNAMFSQHGGVIAVEFPDELQRQAFYDSDQYKEVNTIFVELMKRHGVVDGANVTEKSGKFVVRVPKSVHQKLEIESKREGVSLNQLAVSKLSLPLRDEIGLSVDLIADAFNSVHDGYSTDYVIVHPEKNREFLKKCAALGLGKNERMLNHKLMNIRKTSKYKGMLNSCSKRANIRDYDLFEYASEIAVRALQRLEGATLDLIICDTVLRERFDGIALDLSGFASNDNSVFKLRMAALNLRKGHRLQPIDKSVTEIALASNGPIDTLDLSNLGELPGVYAFYDLNRPVFAGETDNLKLRLDRHLKGGLPSWLKSETSDLVVKSYSLAGFKKQARLDWLARFVNIEKPFLNYQAA